MHRSGLRLAFAPTPSNRWHSSKSLREKWLAHIEAALYRPVLIIDEAQETHSLVLSELRLLASADLDSRSTLTIVLAGDQRLAARLEEPDLLPIANRRCVAPSSRLRNSDT